MPRLDMDPMHEMVVRTRRVVTPTHEVSVERMGVQTRDPSTVAQVERLWLLDERHHEAA